MVIPVTWLKVIRCTSFTDMIELNKNRVQLDMPTAHTRSQHNKPCLSYVWRSLLVDIKEFIGSDLTDSNHTIECELVLYIPSDRLFKVGCIGKAFFPQCAWFPTMWEKICNVLWLQFFRPFTQGRQSVEICSVFISVNNGKSAQSPQYFVRNIKITTAHLVTVKKMTGSRPMTITK